MTDPYRDPGNEQEPKIRWQPKPVPEWLKMLAWATACAIAAAAVAGIPWRGICACILLFLSIVFVIRSAIAGVP